MWIPESGTDATTAPLRRQMEQSHRRGFSMPLGRSSSSSTAPQWHVARCLGWMGTPSTSLSIRNLSIASFLCHGVGVTKQVRIALLVHACVQATLPQGSAETGRQVNSLLGGVGHFLPRIQSVIRVARKYMEMVVPHILISGWSVVLTSGDSFTTAGTPHSVRQATRGTKKFAAKAVRDVQHVLIVAPRYHQAVAPYSSVMVSRNQGENVGIHQDNG